jgi:hypothetical protein
MSKRRGTTPPLVVVWRRSRRLRPLDEHGERNVGVSCLGPERRRRKAGVIEAWMDRESPTQLTIVDCQLTIVSCCGIPAEHRAGFRPDMKSCRDSTGPSDSRLACHKTEHARHKAGHVRSLEGIPPEHRAGFRPDMKSCRDSTGPSESCLACHKTENARHSAGHFLFCSGDRT